MFSNPINRLSSVSPPLWRVYQGRRVNIEVSISVSFIPVCLRASITRFIDVELLFKASDAVVAIVETPNTDAALLG
ncbi:MAG: hypothetical protein V3S97_02760 [Candidatus Bathyarchaeia archaeon]